MEGEAVEGRFAHIALWLDRLHNPAYTQRTKGALGRSLKEMGVPSILHRVARSRGIEIGDDGRMRCPDGYQNGGEFTDINLTNCGVKLAQSALRGAMADAQALSTMRDGKRRDTKFGSLGRQLADVLTPRRDRVRQTNDLIDFDVNAPFADQLKEIKSKRGGRKLFRRPDENTDVISVDSLADDQLVRSLGMAVALESAVRISDAGLKDKAFDDERSRIDQDIAQRMESIAGRLDEHLPGIKYEGRFYTIEPGTDVMYGAYQFSTPGELVKEPKPEYRYTSVRFVVPTELMPEASKNSRITLRTHEGDKDLDDFEFGSAVNDMLGEIEIVGIDHQMNLDALQQELDETNKANALARRGVLLETLKEAGFIPGEFSDAKLADQVILPGGLKRDMQRVREGRAWESFVDSLRGLSDEELRAAYSRELSEMNDPSKNGWILPVDLAGLVELREQLLARGIDVEKSPQEQALESGADFKVEQSLKRVARFLPQPWIDSVDESRVRFKIGDGNRGWNSHQADGPDEINIPLKFLDGPQGDLDSLVLHEYVHSVQHQRTDLNEAQYVFWSRVTGGQPVEQIGHGYGEEEVGVPDDFDHVYIGKVYDEFDENTNRNRRASEVTPVLMEMLLGERYSFSGDNDALFWLLGMLATAGEQ